MGLMKTVKVSQLKKGDILSSGVEILSGPFIVGDYCGQKNRMSVSVKYPSGKEDVRIWGSQTQVKVKGA